MDESLLTKEEKYLSWVPQPNGGLSVLGNFNEFWLIQHKSLKKELSKVVETKAKFSLQNPVKERIFYLEEVASKSTQRALWGSERELTIVAKNEAMDTILIFHRPFKAKAAFFSWLNTESTGWHMEVVGVDKAPIGVVKQVSSTMHKRFDLLDKSEQVQLHIKGPLMEGRLWKEDIQFKVFLPDRNIQVGTIAIKWAGVKKELMEAMDFNIQLTTERTEEDKALLIGAALLIRFMVAVV